ncbi:hypothetical protein QLX08_010130 [Tetragonisca angustula]|uniref:Uncharacterized protein n=1 Tax=Tetragonisca angustula TaxID=166442 RepID=A0AAW0ZDA5_9HYME
MTSSNPFSWLTTSRETTSVSRLFLETPVPGARLKRDKNGRRRQFRNQDFLIAATAVDPNGEEKKFSIGERNITGTVPAKRLVASSEGSATAAPIV